MSRPAGTTTLGSVRTRSQDNAVIANSLPIPPPPTRRKMDPDEDWLPRPQTYRSDPYKALAVSVIEAAIADYITGGLETGDRASARAFLFDGACVLGYSFERLCGALRLDPDAIRWRLAKARFVKPRGARSPRAMEAAA